MLLIKLTLSVLFHYSTLVPRLIDSCCGQWDQCILGAGVANWLPMVSLVSPLVLFHAALDFGGMDPCIDIIVQYTVCQLVTLYVHSYKCKK